VPGSEPDILWVFSIRLYCLIKLFRKQLLSHSGTRRSV
jgi:hypothetical protein